MGVTDTGENQMDRDALRIVVKAGAEYAQAKTRGPVERNFYNNRVLELVKGFGVPRIGH